MRSDEKRQEIKARVEKVISDPDIAHGVTEQIMMSAGLAATLQTMREMDGDFPDEIHKIAEECIPGAIRVCDYIAQWGLDGKEI